MKETAALHHGPCMAYTRGMPDKGLASTIQAAADGRAIALVTVIATDGSAPRHAGARMAVLADGGILGTIGGGRGEHSAREIAAAAARERRGRLVSVTMQGESATESDMLCGGAVTLLVEPLVDREPYRAAARALDQGRRVVLARAVRPTDREHVVDIETMVREEGVPAAPVPWLDEEKVRDAMGRGGLVYQQADHVVLDPIMPAESLLILGAGHIGKALAAAAASMEFAVTVADPRAETFAPGRFPPEVKTVNAPFGEAAAAFPFNAATYVVVATYGHLFDMESLRAIVARPWRYAGFVGSRRKALLLKEQLVAEGCDPARVAALRSPVGLEIGAETPEEIMVSILAEMIAVRRQARRHTAG